MTSRKYLYDVIFVCFRFRCSIASVEKIEMSGAVAKTSEQDDKLTLLSQASVESGISSISSTNSVAKGSFKCHDLEPFRDEEDPSSPTPSISSPQQSSVVVSPASNPLDQSLEGGSFTQSVANAARGSYQETQLAPGSGLVVGCTGEVATAVTFQAPSTPSDDRAKDHKIVGLQQKLQNEVRNRKLLERELSQVKSEKEQLEAELDRLRVSCKDKIDFQRSVLEEKCQELETCQAILAGKEKELDGLSEHCAKELKAAKAQAEEKVKLLKEEHECKLSDLEKKKDEKDKEKLQLELKIAETRRECENKVKTLEINIEIKKREIAEKDKELALKEAEISQLKSELEVERERNEKEALRRNSQAQIEKLKQENSSLVQKLEQFKSTSSNSPSNGSGHHSNDYM